MAVAKAILIPKKSRRNMMPIPKIPIVKDSMVFGSTRTEDLIEELYFTETMRNIFYLESRNYKTDGESLT
jgi:hypothetical protein